MDAHTSGWLIVSGYAAADAQRFTYILAGGLISQQEMFAQKLPAILFFGFNTVLVYLLFLARKKNLQFTFSRPEVRLGKSRMPNRTP